MLIAVIVLGALLLLSALYIFSQQRTNVSLTQELFQTKAALSQAETKAQMLEKDDSRFKAIASEILNENSREFKRQNEERLAEILSPLKNDLTTFTKTVTEVYNNEARERFSLGEKIKELVQLNHGIELQTRDLTNALKGSTRVAGDWGEMILERILEESGLRKNQEYFLQSSVTLEQGKRLQPDAVVRYPDGRCVVIDSKVSLSAFLEMQQQTDPEQQRKLEEHHALLVQKHIDELKGKQYQEYVGDEKLDFVMMFIPNEPAYLVAMNRKPQLWEIAYDAHVLIVSPTHLISALRLIEQLWRRDRQSQNAINIATEGAKLYEKLYGFLADLEAIDKSLASASKSFEQAMRKLKTGPGNVFKRAENMRQMGIKVSKIIAEKGEEDSLG